MKNLLLLLSFLFITPCFAGQAVTGNLTVTGNTGIGSTDPASKLSIVGNGTTSATSSLTIRDSAFAPKFVVQDNGNVGIGTAVPVAILSIVGSNSSTIINNASIANPRIFNPNTTDGNYSALVFSSNRTTAGTEYNASRIGNVNTAHADAAESSDLFFSTRLTGTANERMRITGSGNVGIGTASPTGFEIQGKNVGIGTSFTSQSAISVMSGNVGIGTWVPQKILAVNGDVQIGGLNSAFSASSKLRLSVFNPVASTNDYLFAVGSQNNNLQFYIQDGVAPSFVNGLISNQLNLGGSGYFAGTIYSAQDNGNYFHIANGSNNNTEISAAGSNPILFGKAYLSTEYARFNGSGNFGIGTINPGTTLDVVGTIRASSGTAGQATCWKADKTLGQCTSVVGALGACTCT